MTDRHPWQRPAVTTVTVARTITITFTGSESAFIELADRLTPGGLDTMDGGDAVGAFVDLYNHGETPGPWHRPTADGIVTIDHADDLYRWNPAPEPARAESPVIAAIREAIALGLDGESIAGIDLLLTRLPHLAPTD